MVKVFHYFKTKKPFMSRRVILVDLHFFLHAHNKKNDTQLNDCQFSFLYFFLFIMYNLWVNWFCKYWNVLLCIQFAIYWLIMKNYWTFQTVYGFPCIRYFFLSNDASSLLSSIGKDFTLPVTIVLGNESSHVFATYFNLFHFDPIDHDTGNISTTLQVY